MIFPGASDCSACGAVFDGANFTIPASRSGAAVDPAADISNLVAVKMIFTLLAVAWPFTSIAALFMFDSPASGGLVVNLLLLATVMYGPVYFVAWWVARSKQKDGDSSGALMTWLYLCGGNVAVWFAAAMLLGVVCGGKFACR